MRESPFDRFQETGESRSQLVSRRTFLGQISVVSVYSLGQTSSPASAREALSAIFTSRNSSPFDAAQWKTFGRIVLRRLKSSLLIEDGFAVHEASPANCDFSFAARTPEDVEEVQIWAGIRCRDRDSRYVFALRGGNNDDLYLARYSPNGQNRFLGIAPLEFHPVPGTWYRLRVVARDQRFQIYLNGESVPRLDIRDDSALWLEGGASLGGGWLPTEFRDVSICPSAEHAIADREIEERKSDPEGSEKEERRATRRMAYRSVVLGSLKEPRTELSLNGGWLFAPDQELSSSAHPQSETCDDSSWHVLDVPDFWTPCLSWLYGETGFPELNGLSSSKGISDRLWRAELERLNGYTFDWRQTSSGWYRHYIELPAEISGRRFELCFDAIAKVSEIWVNDLKVGAHVGMFGPVRCDITAAIHPGSNIVAVHVLGRLQTDASNQIMGVAVTVEVTAAMLKSLPHGMYREEAAGIWQPAKLIVTKQAWIEDVFVKPKLDRIDCEVTLQSKASQVLSVSISYSIHSRRDGILYGEPAGEAQPLASGQLVFKLSSPQLAPRIWSPVTPNMYVLEVVLWSGGEIFDRRRVSFGFRTFSVKDGKLHLNGKPYWLRGANHFPHSIRPNDAVLARRFMQLAREGNVAATRSHTAPFSETWLQAADEAGVMVSFEGTWPWLMLEGEPPSNQLLEEWSSEFLALIRKARNHPSVVMWTVNNEMKFEEVDQNRPALLQKKWEILSRMVKEIRALDPSRPIDCDSSYCRRSVGKEYEDLIRPDGYDDGDLDDAHRYPGWYESSFFHYFQGQFGKELSYPGRPLISQEMSTGYPRNDDGHPCRFYLFKHYTPQALVGYEAYENRNPAIFLERQALITKELAEAIRRTNRDDCSGIMHFACLTWFKDVWNAKSIRPFQTYDSLKLALQPVLVSAELFGRHFYSSSQHQIRACIANDAEDAENLPEGELAWQIEDQQRTLASGAIKIEPVPYYSNHWCDLTVSMPAIQSNERINARLSLRLRVGGTVRSENTYDIVVASSSWAQPARPVEFAVLSATESIPSVLQSYKVRFVSSPGGLRQNETVVIPDGERFLSNPETAAALRAHALSGGNVLVLHGGEALTKLFPKKIKGYTPGYMEIATMRIPESAVFDGLEQLDFAWWEIGSRQIPGVSRGYHQLAVDATDIEVLAEVVNFHGYLRNSADFLRVSGSPLFSMRCGLGRWVSCELMLCETAPFDPIAGRLLSNLLAVLSPR